MTREELFSDIFAAHLEPDDIVYFERCGEDYLWQHLTHDATTARLRPNPDAWIYYSGKWPARDAECWPAFSTTSWPKWKRWLAAPTGI